MPRKQKRKNTQAPPPKCSACNLACHFNLLRCDHCFRGVHLTCAKLSKQEAAQLGVYVCGSCIESGVTEEAVTAARNGKPRALVFVSTCLHHNADTRRWKRSVPPPAEFPNENIDKKKECDICDHKCVAAAEILCDRCDVGHHYLCVDMTEALADTIDKWYCGQCVGADPTLQVTYTQPVELASNASASPAPANRKNLGAAKRRPLVKRKLTFDDDEPGPSKRTRQGSIHSGLMERKATETKAASDRTVASEAAQSSVGLPGTTTVGSPLQSAAVEEPMQDENRQTPDATVELRKRGTPLEKTDNEANRKRQTEGDALAEKHRVGVEKLKAQLAAQDQLLNAAAKREQDHTVELASLKKRIAELESAQHNGRNDGDQQPLATEGNAGPRDEPGASRDTVEVDNAETENAAESRVPGPDEHLRMKLLNVIGEENPDVRHVPTNASRKLTDWTKFLEPEGREELSKWTFGSPFEIFKDQKVLAEGGQGAVHLVELKRSFAVKKVELKIDDPDKLEFLIREGKYAYVLAHKNLLSVLYRYIDGDNAYLVYPFMDAGDIRDIMVRLRRCLTEAEAAFVIRKTLDALVYLHGNHVAHRDIKPQNVLSNLKGDIMVADLGLCGDTTKPRVTGVGTADFLPPELATARQRGSRGFEHDEKVDAWSLGVTLFELLTERYPVGAKNLTKLYAKIRNADFMRECRRIVKAANIHLSEECWAFLARCFVHEPQGRATAEELRQSDFVKKAKPDDWKKAVHQAAAV